MRSLNPPPDEHAEAYEQLLRLYGIYEQYSKALLDTNSPEPFSTYESNLLESEIEKINTRLKIIKPKQKTVKPSTEPKEITLD